MKIERVVEFLSATHLPPPQKAPVYGALKGAGGRMVANFAKNIFIAKLTCILTSGVYR